MNEDTLLTTFQAADYCKTSYMSIRRWINTGKLKAHRTPGGHHRISKHDLIDFMLKNDIPVPEKGYIINRKVLIIDDDIRIRESISNYLRTISQNYEIATVENGFDAGLILNNFAPDIIILDLMMPKIDGFKACMRIKTNPSTKNTKIIVLTGYANKKNINKALKCGADKVISKPIEMEKLLEEINALI